MPICCMFPKVAAGVATLWKLNEEGMAKNLILWLVIAIILMSLFESFNSSDNNGRTIDYTSFISSVQNDQVQEVIFDGTVINGLKRNGEQFSTVMPIHDGAILDSLLSHNVRTSGTRPEEPGLLTSILVSWMPMLLLIGVWIFFMRQMQGGSKGNPLSFGKSKAKLLSESQVKTTFGDVAGCDEAKEDVVELVDFLRDPSKYQKLGGRIPRGVLMVGPPGTGKTLLARAIAGEAKVPFFSISGSDFVEMFVGVGASRVRDMFAQAKKNAPCIVFIDEIDAVGRKRGVGLGGGHDEREQTLNQLLVEMDGFEGFEAVIVIAATNRPDVLDPALLRPGRFDRQVTVGLPDVRGREQILKVHMKKVPLSSDVDAALLARGTPGFSGAELANLVNEAALSAARANLRTVGMREFEQAKDKLLMGAERRSLIMNDHEKANTAYHEAGHAIVGRLVPDHDPVYKVSIIPRGRALGVTSYLPEQDRYSQSKQYLLSRISALFAGRIAEEIVFGEDAVTTGASNDIERATDIARRMVTRWGFSKKLPPMQFDQDQDQSQYLGGGHVSTMPVADKTTLIIDEEVSGIINFCYDRAKQMLTEYRDVLEAMKDALLKYETIDASQIDDLMNRRPCRPPSETGAHDKKSSDSNDSNSSNGQDNKTETKSETASDDSKSETKSDSEQKSESTASEQDAAPAAADSESKAEAKAEPEQQSTQSSEPSSSSAQSDAPKSAQWPYNTPSGNKADDDKK